MSLNVYDRVYVGEEVLVLAADLDWSPRSGQTSRPAHADRASASRRPCWRGGARAGGRRGSRKPSFLALVLPSITEWGFTSAPPVSRELSLPPGFALLFLSLQWRHFLFFLLCVLYSFTDRKLFLLQLPLLARFHFPVSVPALSHVTLGLLPSALSSSYLERQEKARRCSDLSVEAIAHTKELKLK